MAVIHIIYDPLDPPIRIERLPDAVKVARLPIPDTHVTRDACSSHDEAAIGDIARRLAELLLEQLR